MKIVLNKTRLIFNIGIAIFYSMMVTLPLVAAQELLPGQSGRTVAEIEQATDLLFEAVQSNNVAQATQAIMAGAHVDALLENGSTLLHVAAARGYDAMATCLLANRAQVDKGADNGATPLMSAVAGNHRDIAGILLARGACVNAATNEGATSLFFAAFRGDDAMVKMLLDNGADVKQSDNERKTPLKAALIRNHPVIVRRLVFADSQTIVECKMLGNNGGVPICIGNMKDHNDKKISLLFGGKEPGTGEILEDAILETQRIRDSLGQQQDWLVSPELIESFGLTRLLLPGLARLVGEYADPLVTVQDATRERDESLNVLIQEQIAKNRQRVCQRRDLEHGVRSRLEQGFRGRLEHGFRSRLEHGVNFFKKCKEQLLNKKVASKASVNSQDRWTCHRCAFMNLAGTSNCAACRQSFHDND